MDIHVYFSENSIYTPYMSKFKLNYYKPTNINLIILGEQYKK